MDELVGKLDVAERLRRPGSQELIVIAGGVMHPRPALEHPKDSADHETGRVIPGEVSPQLPAVDDVAHEKKVLGLEPAEEVEEFIRP